MLRSPLLPVGLSKSVLPIGLMLSLLVPGGVFLCPPTLTALVAEYPEITSLVEAEPSLIFTDAYAELLAMMTEEPAIAFLLQEPEIFAVTEDVSVFLIEEEAELSSAEGVKPVLVAFVEQEPAIATTDIYATLQALLSEYPMIEAGCQC